MYARIFQSVFLSFSLVVLFVLAACSSTEHQDRVRLMLQPPAATTVVTNHVTDDAAFDKACARMDSRRSSWLVHDGKLCINGRISPELDRALASVLRQGAARGGDEAGSESGIGRIHQILLNSGGGNRLASQSLAARIERSGIPVTVPEGAICKSGCVLLLAAAREARVDPGAVVSVHYAFTTRDGETRVSARGTRRYFRGIDPTMRLYADYRQEMLRRGMISPGEDDRNFTRPHRTKSKFWTDEAFWDLDSKALRAYGIIAG